jgi:hypothetical protein
MSSPNTMSKSDGVERREGRAKGVRVTAEGRQGACTGRARSAPLQGGCSWWEVYVASEMANEFPQSRLSGFGGLCR